MAQSGLPARGATSDLSMPWDDDDPENPFRNDEEMLADKKRQREISERSVAMSDTAKKSDNKKQLQQ